MSIWAWDKFALTVRNQPNSAAITQGTTTISYAELAHYAETVATGLKITPGERVLICASNSISVVALIVAIWRLGAIPVMVNSEAPLRHITHILQLTNARLLFTSEEVTLKNIETCPIPDRAMYRSEARGLPPHGRCGDHHASIIFTSGSTGLPKGVTQRASTLISGATRVSNALGYRDSDSILCCVPFTFDYGWGQVLSALFCGIHLILPEQLNGFGICSALDAHHPTIVAGVPATYADLVLGLAPIISSQRDSVRLITNTGSKIPVSILDSLIQLFPKAALSLNYGLTETYRTTTLPVELSRSHRNSVGYPLPGVKLQIVKPDGRHAEPNEEGEIHHIGAGLFDIYWGNPEQTAACRIALDLEDGTTVIAMRTGDFGYFDEEGLLYLTGRKDRIVKCMGVRVSLEEIEDEIYATNLVKEAAVTALDHEIFGVFISAHIVSNSTETPLKEREEIRRLRRALREKLSNYMQPRKFVLHGSLPRTSSNKVDYVRLRERSVG